MPKDATEGVSIERLLNLSRASLRRAAAELAGGRLGRRVTFPDDLIAALVVAAILKRRKTKSAQYRFLCSRRRLLMKHLGLAAWPSRATYFRRYARAWAVLQRAITREGERAVREGLAEPELVAVDQSLVTARGPRWNKRARAAGRVPRGADLEAAWGHSGHRGWVLGYGYEVAVTAGKGKAIWPLSASADVASRHPKHTFPEKAKGLPEGTRYVLADAGYDANAHAEAVERRPDGSETGRTFVCPQIYRRGEQRRPDRPRVEKGARRRARERRDGRRAFFESETGRSLFKRRGASVEPFNDWLKSTFDFGERAWHRGLGNNRTQLLASIFAYQLLLRLNHALGRPNNRVRWIVDAL